VTGWRSAALVAGLVAALTAMAGPAAARSEFRFKDRAITESSGLVATDTHVVTVNDSGNDPLLFLVSRTTGRTVQTTRITPGDTVDIEALSPGVEPHSLWVGDIGDNSAQRSTLTLYRTTVPDPAAKPREAVAYRVRYSDGAHDAEALMIDSEGRVLIATKGAFGGRLYRSKGVPRPDSTTVLRPVARVPGLVTDGAFSPDGSVLYLRTYVSVTGYSYPSMRLRGTEVLPAQQQGEGLAVDGVGHVLISSEGVHQPVLRVALPHEMRQGFAPADEDVTSPPAANGEPPPSAGEDGGSLWRWWPVLLVPAGLLLLRAARPRSRRTR
jgi:hypothetical protein